MGSITFNAAFAQEESKSKNWRFKDIDIPIVKDSANFDLQANFDLDAIRNSLRNIFNWRKGERILNPEFGNPLNDYMYEPITDETARSIGASIKNAINTWEPRVRIVSVNVFPDEDSNEYYVEIEVNVPTLNINSITYNYILPSA